MAKLIKGILGGYSGKLGDTVGIYRNGKHIVQQAPTLEKGKTPTQLEEQAQKIRLLREFWRTCPADIYNVFSRTKKGKDAYWTHLMAQSGKIRLVNGILDLTNLRPTEAEIERRGTNGYLYQPSFPRILNGYNIGTNFTQVTPPYDIYWSYWTPDSQNRGNTRVLNRMAGFGGAYWPSNWRDTKYFYGVIFALDSATKMPYIGQAICFPKP